MSERNGWYDPKDYPSIPATDDNMPDDDLPFAEEETGGDIFIEHHGTGTMQVYNNCQFIYADK